MSDSILQVNLIKNKGGSATGITIADSTANISIGTTLAVNTINEVTSANGVTVDGLSLKDGNVVPASGKGIDFSAGSTSNGVTGEVLEHVETGTYTPQTKDGSGNTVGADSARGRYSVLGNVIFVEFLFQIANLSGAIGSDTHFQLTIPVTSGNFTQTPRNFVDLYNSNGTDFYSAYLIFSGSQQPTMYLYHNVGATKDGTGSNEQYKGSDASSGTFLIRGNFYYFI